MSSLFLFINNHEDIQNSSSVMAAVIAATVAVGAKHVATEWCWVLQ